MVKLQLRVDEANARVFKCQEAYQGEFLEVFMDSMMGSPVSEARAARLKAARAETARAKQAVADARAEYLFYLRCLLVDGLVEHD